MRGKEHPGSSFCLAALSKTVKRKVSTQGKNKLWGMGHGASGMGHGQWTLTVSVAYILHELQ